MLTSSDPVSITVPEMVTCTSGALHGHETEIIVCETIGTVCGADMSPNYIRNDANNDALTISKIRSIVIIVR